MIKLISMQNSGEDTQSILKIQVLEGNLHRDTEKFGKMDPYFLIEDQKKNVYRTPTLQDVGKNPKWNHTLEVPIESLDEILRIAVYDEDIINDTLIGEENFKVSTLLGKNNLQTLTINFKSKKAGEVTLSCSLHQIQRKNSQSDIKIKLEDNNFKSSGQGTILKIPNLHGSGG